MHPLIPIRDVRDVRQAGIADILICQFPICGRHDGLSILNGQRIPLDEVLQRTPEEGALIGEGIVKYRDEVFQNRRHSVSFRRLNLLH